MYCAVQSEHSVTAVRHWPSSAPEFGSALLGRPWTGHVWPDVGKNFSLSITPSPHKHIDNRDLLPVRLRRQSGSNCVCFKQLANVSF